MSVFDGLDVDKSSKTRKAIIVGIEVLKPQSKKNLIFDFFINFHFV
jgi:hypothetical protein